MPLSLRSLVLGGKGPQVSCPLWTVSASRRRPDSAGLKEAARLDLSPEDMKIIRRSLSAMEAVMKRNALNDREAEMVSATAILLEEVDSGSSIYNRLK
jgi:hypothetical protein